MKKYIWFLWIARNIQKWQRRSLENYRAEQTAPRPIKLFEYFVCGKILKYNLKCLELLKTIETLIETLKLEIPSQRNFGNINISPCREKNATVLRSTGKYFQRKTNLSRAIYKYDKGEDYFFVYSFRFCVTQNWAK